MKRFLLLLCLLLPLLFVSCTPEGKGTEPLAYVSILQNHGKAITTDLVGPSFSELFMTYTARKADGGPSTGQVEDAPLFSGEPIGPFSVGYWDFTVTAYSDDRYQNAVYEGTTEGVLLTQGSSNVIGVTLHMVYDPTSYNGSLDLRPLIKNLTPTTRITVRLEAPELSYDETFTVKNTKEESGIVSPLISHLRPSYYNVTMTAHDGVDTIFFESKVLILNNVTTIIGGYYRYNNIYVSLSGPEDPVVTVLAGEAAKDSNIHYYINHVGAYTSVSTDPGNAQAMEAAYASGQYFYKDGTTGQYHVLSKDQLAQFAYGEDYELLSDEEKASVDAMGFHGDDVAIEAARADENFREPYIRTYEGYFRALETSGNGKTADDARRAGYQFFLNAAGLAQANKGGNEDALEYALTHGSYSYVQYINANATIPVPSGGYLIGIMLTAVEKEGDEAWNQLANEKTYEIADIGCDRHPGLFLNTDNIYVAKHEHTVDYARNFSKRDAFAPYRTYYINHLGNRIYFESSGDIGTDMGAYYINSQGLFVAKGEDQNVATSSAAWQEWRYRGGATAFINCYGLYTDVVASNPSLARKLAQENSHSFYVQYADYTTSVAPPKGNAWEKIGIMLTVLPSVSASSVQKALLDRDAIDLMERRGMNKVIDRNPNLFINSHGVFEAVSNTTYGSGDKWALAYSQILKNSYYIGNGRVFTFISGSNCAIISAVKEEGRSWYVDTKGVYYSVLSDISTAHVAALNGKTTYVKKDGTTGMSSLSSGLTALGYYQAEEGEDLLEVRSRAVLDGQSFFLDDEGLFHSVAASCDEVTHAAAIYSGASQYASHEVSEKYLTGEYDKETFLSELMDTGYEGAWKDQ
ncbi:MAG: hypothetical protein KBS81_07805 [Spirochaetales bacterium]|nr:hypothetical protein [Candidatus Physcosoma equi]